MLRGGPLAKRSVLLVAAAFCLAADPPVPEAPLKTWYVDAGDTALDYRAPGSVCPSDATFRERASDLYGFEDPFVPSGIRARTLIRVEITKTQVGYRGVISVMDPATGALLRQSGEEEQSSCDSLVWVLSHRMRLVVSPRPTAKSPAPVEEPNKDPEIQRRLDALEEAAEDQEEINHELRTKIAALQQALADEKKRKMDLTYALSAGALLTANLTSNVGPGAWVGGELRAGPIALGLELRTVFPAPLAAGPYDFDLSQYVALLTPCGRYSYFFGCVIAGAGAQLSYDSNFPGGTRSRTSPLIQVGGRVGAELPFGDTPLSGRAWGEVLYSTPPTDINYIETDVTYTAARPDVSVFFGIGLVVRFGKEGT